MPKFNISEDIHRLMVCQWAYGWSQEKLIFEIREIIDRKSFEYYFERKAEEERVLNNLIFELKNREDFNTQIFREDKIKSYGNKYVKRKYRF